MSTLKPIPPALADELEAARKVAVNWLKMQWLAGLHLVNTGRRDKYPGHEFRSCRLAADAALARIEEIKREYPS